MSGAAVRYVERCTHPKVKASVREVFEIIARHVPEGHTTTPVLGMDVLAAEAGLHRRTIWSALQVLIDIGELQVFDGGQGITGRYTVVHLDGERPPIEAPLPFRADLRAVPARPIEAPPAADGVRLAEDEQSAKTITSTDHNPNKNVLVITSGPALVITSWLRRVLVITSTVLQGFRRLQIPMVWLARRVLVITSTFLTHPLVIDDARARDVHTFKNVHTQATGPPADVPIEPKPPPIVHPWHAWCGRVVCVPTKLHEDWLRKGHDAVWLFAFYARRDAAIPRGQRITVDDFTFWRTAMKEELAREAKARTPTPGTRAPIPDNDLFARAAEERRQRYGGGS